MVIATQRPSWQRPSWKSETTYWTGHVWCFLQIKLQWPNSKRKQCQPTKKKNEITLDSRKSWKDSTDFFLQCLVILKSRAQIVNGRSSKGLVRTGKAYFFDSFSAFLKFRSFYQDLILFCVSVPLTVRDME